ncbi:MAG: hypothetical protein IJT91_04465 [Clostridia bacterium]|nr:hypothetical protein [Clostridia bacterium]
MSNKFRKPKPITEPETEPNEEYLGLSSSFRAAKYITLIFLIVFLVAMTSIFRRDITAENFKYLVRYMNTTALEYSGDYRTIYYDPNDTTDIALFNNDIAVLKNNSVALFDLRGNNTFNYTLNYTDSMMVSAGKYILVYDMTAGRYDILNNFTSLHSESFEYPITAAAIASNGTYAVVTRDIQFRSVIKIYDSHFRLITNIYKDKYVMDIRINETGDELLIISVYAESGNIETEVMTYSPYSENANNTFTIDGSMGISGGYHKDGSYTVLCDSGIVFFNKKGKNISQFDFGQTVPTKGLHTENYTIFTHDRNVVGEASVITFFDPTGKEKAATVIAEKIVDMKYHDGYLYVLSENRLYRYSPENDELTYCDIESGGTRLFAYDRNTALIAYTGKIKVYSLSEMFSTDNPGTEAAGSTTDTAEVSETTAAETAVSEEQSDNES